jgi:enoyl-CoA hydratase
MSGEVLMNVVGGEGGNAGIVHVTLRHPGRLNAMSRPMWRQLRAVFEGIQASDARCVVIAGEGGAFCAGGDISEYPGFRFDAATLRDFHENDVWGGLQAMLACDVPIVASVSGACMGAGVEIASCCDLRIAGQSARFGAPIAKLGFPMAPREAQLVAGAVGDATARQMLLEAATFSTADMLARGFLSRVVADDQVADEALASALRVAALAPGAARMNKQLLRALKVPPAQPNHALAAIENIVNGGRDCDRDPYAYADSAEHREGVTAFLEKRSPRF